MDSLAQVCNYGMVLHTVFVDFAKTFDQGWHILLSYAIYGQLLARVRVFLPDRCFTIKVGPSVFDHSLVLNRLQGGLVFEPFLFLIFTNDLPCNIQRIIVIYAYDVTTSGYRARTKATGDEPREVLVHRMDPVC